MFDLFNNKLWMHFVKSPMDRSHVRELARKLDLSPSTILKLIDELNKKKLLITKKEGKNLIIRANYDNELFIFYKKWSNLALLLDSGIIAEIGTYEVESIILFGSYSKGEDTEKSDIDIATDKELRLSDSEKFAKILKRKIQFHKIDKENEMLFANIRQGILLGGIMP